MEIQHFNHDDTLTFRMVSDTETDIICFLCTYQIRGPAYACEDCNFWLHKSCSEVPKVIEKHPFHPTHSLFHYNPDSVGDIVFICDGCHHLSSKNRYVCKRCDFNLDFNCASLTDNEVEVRKRCSGVKTTRSHFSHKHHLTLCRSRDKFRIRCLACKDVISGPAYICLDCNFLLHETCLYDIPQEVDTVFHPQHLLLPKPMSDDSQKACDACSIKIKGFGFECDDCKFYLHVSCAKYQTRALKHEFHEHALLYFRSGNIGRNCYCDYCGESCSASFFCCITCQFDIHLECLSLPVTVKHNRHFHQLTLKDSIMEDDLGQYYCDICETERNPKDHVYYCEECNYIAHIDCVLSQIEPPEKIYSYLIPRPEVEYKQEMSENKTDDQTLEREPDIAADQKPAWDKHETNAEDLGEQDEETTKMLDEIDFLGPEQGRIENETDDQTLEREPDIAADQKPAWDKHETNAEDLDEQDEETTKMLDEIDFLGPEQGQIENKTDDQTLEREPDIAADQKPAWDKHETNAEDLDEQDEETTKMLDEIDFLGPEQGQIENKTDDQTLEREPDIAVDQKLARGEHETNAEDLDERDEETTKMLDEIDKQIMELEERIKALQEKSSSILHAWSKHKGAP